MAKRWAIYYKGWCITHDAYGKLACYRMSGGTLEWCYFGNTLRDIKAEIYCREFFQRVAEIQKANGESKDITHC